MKNWWYEAHRNQLSRITLSIPVKMVDVLVVAGIFTAVGVFSIVYYKLFDFCVRKRLEAIRIPEEQIMQERYEIQKRRLTNQARNAEYVCIERTWRKNKIK